MSDKWQEYVNDSRTICKYGAKCYQKSPEHHQKFKHPPQNNKRKNIKNQYDKKRIRLQNQELEKKHDNEEVDQKNENAYDKTAEHNLDLQLDEALAIIPSSSTATLDGTSTDITFQLPEIIKFHNQPDEKLMKELFLVHMPSDFYKFFDCIKSEPSFEKTLAIVNLELIGPYELLLGKLPVVDKELYLIHWRFFFDPPEFQAVLKRKGKSQYHIGYYRDVPDEKPVFLAHNDSARDCHITPMADNIFGAVYWYLDIEKKKSPFSSIACQKLMDKVKKWAGESNYSISEYSIKKRQANCTTKTFHGAGIMVPYNKKTQIGYRKLVETDAAIKKMFTQLKEATTQTEKDKVLSELQPVITYANIAVDECDFGTGLEIGIDLFCSGLKDLEPSALSTLCVAYSLLKREAFAKIIQAHLKCRRKGPDMSLLDLATKQ